MEDWQSTWPTIGPELFEKTESVSPLLIFGEEDMGTFGWDFIPSTVSYPQSITSAHFEPVDLFTAAQPKFDDDKKPKGFPSASRQRKRSKGSRSNAKSSLDQFSESKRSQMLAKNRQAANRYRLRQNEYVKSLERRSRSETVKKEAHRAMLRSLQMQVSCLKIELIKHINCDCKYIRNLLITNANLLDPRMVAPPSSDSSDAEDCALVH